MEKINHISTDLNSLNYASEKEILLDLEKSKNKHEDLPEQHDLVDKESPTDKTRGMSTDSTNQVAVSANGIKHETELYAKKKVTENELPEPIERSSYMREEVRDGAEISQEASDWFNEECSLDRKDKGGDSVNPFIDPVGSVYFENDTELCTDKIVMEYQLPELVCFKDGAYHQVVKDICVDDGLLSCDKISIENLDLHDKGLLSFLQTDFYINDSWSKEMVETSDIVPNQTNPFVKCDYEEDVSRESAGENFLGNGEEYFEEIGKTVSNQYNPFLQYDCEIDVDICSSKSSTSNSEGEVDHIEKVNVNEEDIPEKLHLAQQLEVDDSHTHQGQFDFDGKEGHQLADQDTSKEEDIASNITCIAEDSYCNEQKDIPSDSKSEIGSIITFDFPSSPPGMDSGEKDLQNAETQLPAQTLNTWNTDEAAVDSRTASNRSFFVHNCGDSILSMTDVSGPIPYSGQIPYSGSTSLRSDSSTTSTRSFAFPVMHSEWNSSPVKMAKADPRSYRRHRGWRISRFCCRF
ncbi:hypothetical protein Sjap_014920 [Stephania japonica]|uniref:Uncharacterized protein n=1 Tax=Stephania japonica TaxID=461633 RepID=A0AAP0NQW7_9MAGN